MNFSRVAEKIIEYTFYALFLLVPLIWLPVNSELFEFNKMILVYLSASIVLTVWLFKSVAGKTFVIKRTPLDIPIALFLLANTLSTAFSIDRHISIFGYYGDDQQKQYHRNKHQIPFCIIPNSGYFH